MAERDIYNTKPSIVVIYSASWCPDCKRSKNFFDRRGIKYLEVDIGKDNEAYLFVEKITRRVRIPTIIFPDSTVMIEPGDDDLEAKLEGKLSQ